MSKTISKRCLLLSILLLLIVYSSVHEFGHWLVAYFDGADILAVHLFPPSVVVNEYSFSSIPILILFKLAGFLITFIPSVLTFIYFNKRKSSWWVFSFIWIMASPATSYHDFLDIGRIIGNYSLGIGLCMMSFAMTITLFIWFAKSYLKSVFR